MSSPSPTTIKAVQTASIFATAAASGGAMSLSFFLVPRLLESPTPLMLRQWERTLHRGRDVFVPINLVASAGFAFLAFSRSFSSRAARCYAAAAVLSAGIVPFTLLLVVPTNNKLLRRAKLAKGLTASDELVEPADERESSRFLVDRWGVLNLARSTLVVASGLLGLYASLW